MLNLPVASTSRLHHKWRCITELANGHGKVETVPVLMTFFFRVIFGVSVAYVFTRGTSLFAAPAIPGGGRVSLHLDVEYR